MYPTMVKPVLSLLSPIDTQNDLREYLQSRRKALKLSRVELASRSTVPAPTIKKFESTGQISLRQFMLIWQCLDDLTRLRDLTHTSTSTKLPNSIDEVLNEL
jgi:transcriptional regulator with XRE-family HTH domain